MDQRLDVAGIWVAGRACRGGGPIVEIRSPFSDELVGRIATAGEADAQKAIDTAHACFKSTMRHLPVHRRVAILNRAADLLAARSEELATCLTRESGKPISLSRAEARRGGDIL